MDEFANAGSRYLVMLTDRNIKSFVKTLYLECSFIQYNDNIFEML